VDTYSGFVFGEALRTECWGCGRAVSAPPEQMAYGEAVEVDCPHCQTSHYFAEDADGNLHVTEAVREDGTLLHMH
jgi:hypothetical protein